MTYIDEQYALLETFEKGRLVQELTEDELYTYQFLIQRNLLQPRADIKDGLHFLSEQGKCVLAEHRSFLKQLDKNADDLAKSTAAEKKAKASDRFHDFLLLFIGAAITYFFDHAKEIIDWISGFFS